MNKQEYDEMMALTRVNKWVTGNYEMEKIDVPEGIPTQNIVNPKVSIVIPYYNYPQYIRKCVESCLNQTVKPHEIILVNDGSPCHINSHIRRWMMNPNFIYINQKNQGESMARNNGGERATGDYIIFLDADDYIRGDYIEKTLGAIGDKDVCIPDMIVFNEANYELRYPDYTWEELHKQQIMPSTCCLFKMQAWINTKFDPNIVYCDWEMYLKMAHAGYSFTNCHEFLFFYNRKLDSNIAKLDARKEEGLNQLTHYSIRRD
jgi:glycosyltransferase involved in cell wall biosynthesis